MRAVYFFLFVGSSWKPRGLMDFEHVGVKTTEFMADGSAPDVSRQPQTLGPSVTVLTPPLTTGKLRPTLLHIWHIA